MTFEQSLEIEKDYSSQTPLHPVVMDKYREYIQTGQYPYLERVVDFILLSYPELSYKRDAIKTQVYFASDKYRKEKEAEFADTMISQGWSRIERGIVKRAKEQGRKIELFKRSDGMLGKHELTVICRPMIDADGNEFLMPPKCRRRGYLLRNLIQPMSDYENFVRLI